METNLFKSINLIRCVSGANLNLFRYAAMVVVLLLGVGNAWGNSYYSQFTAKSGNTAQGLVYAAGSNSEGAIEDYTNQVTPAKHDGSSGAEYTWYAWAKAARGYKFKTWTQGSNINSNGTLTNAATTFGVKHSNSDNGITAGDATATFEAATAYTITYKQPENFGGYTAEYANYSISNNAFVDYTKTITMTSSSANTNETSYASDKVTLTATARLGAFLGWYVNGSKVSDKADGYTFNPSETCNVEGRWEEAQTNIPMTFKAVEQDDDSNYKGYYTVDAQSVQATDYNTTTGSNYYFEATLTAYPADGYVFTGWYTKEGKKRNFISYDNPFNAYFDQETTLYASFSYNNYTDDQKAQFKVGSTPYTDLNAANAAAAGGSNKTIVCTRDGILPPGNYTISSGVKLYIPGASETFQTKPTEVTTAETLTANRTLVFADGANVICNGTIGLGGKIMAGSGGSKSGYVTGSCGMIDMSRGGHIELNEGSTLYAWGIIKGQDMDQGNNTLDVGTITANSGATIWEDFAMGDWRGGTATSNIKDQQSSWKLFPFQSYSVQNIEIPVTYLYNSTLAIYTSLNATGGPYDADLALIGNSNTLFLMKDKQSVVRKWYDPTSDLSCYELSGSAVMDALDVSISGIISVNSGGFYLPISNSMHIILTGCNMTLSKPMTMQAGSVIEIKDDATLNLEARLHMFDKDEWGLYIHNYYFRSFNNLTIHKNRGNEDSNAGIDDAKLIVDGTLNVVSGKGYIYATNGGANIMGNGGGKITYGGALPSSTTIHNVTVGTKAQGYIVDAPNAIAAANLCNEDGSYTQSIASTTFHNINGRWFTAAAKDEKANHTYDFTYISSGAVSGTGGTNTTTDAVYSWDKTGLELRQKWFNVTADCNEEGHYWWHGQGEQTGWFYNWTLNSAWHQFLPTATIGMYSGSNNTLYTKSSCTWEELGSTDVNCLYEIGGVKKALVDGQFVALSPNDDDPAYHETEDPTKYYICFEGCNWHAADKYTEAKKAYIIEPDTFIWYNNAWMSVNFKKPFAYTLDETNVPVYYEYVDGDWTLAEPYVRVVDGLEDRSYYFLDEAFKFASSVLRTAPTITILRDISGITTAISYTGTKTCTLDLNGKMITGSVSSMLTINGTGCTFIIEDNTKEKNGKINLYYSANARRYAVNVTKGHLKLKSGTISSTNTMLYATGQTSTTSAAIIVKASQQCTIEGGRVYAQADHNPFGIYGDGNSSTITVKGGEVIASVGLKSEPRGIQVTGGTLNVKDDALIEATTYSSGTTGEGILVNCAAGYHATLNMTGGTVKSTTKTSSIGVYVNCAYTYDTNEPRNITAWSRAEANISAGEIQVSNINGSTAEGVRSLGTTNISGGKITVRPTTTTAFGVRLFDGTTTISNNADIDVSATSGAYGVRISQEAPANKAGTVYNGILNMTGGKLTVRTSSTTEAYGVYVGASSTKITTTHASNSSYYAGNYANAGTATISGGLIDVQARTTKAYGVYVVGPVSQSGAEGYPIASATPNCSITGGKFKVSSMSGSTTEVAATNVSSSTYTISGGYYNNQENIGGYTVAPKHVVTLPTSDANYPEYLYKVANAYQVTFFNGEDVLQSSYQQEGIIPTYMGAEPQKASDGGYSYEFDGWSTTNGGPVVNPLPTVSSAGATYYAHFEATDLRYTISLDATTNGGTCAEEYIRIVPGSAAGELPSAAKEGHTFAGWFTAVSGGTQLTSSTVVSGDITYYAQFIVNSYTLTYELGEGAVKTAGVPFPANNKTGTQSQSVAYGTAITAPVVTRTGYTFSRWNAIVAPTMPSENVTYTPLWNPNTNTAYTVKHLLQDADGSGYTEVTEDKQALTGTTGATVTPDPKSYDGFITPAKQSLTIAADGKAVLEYNYDRVVYTINWNASANGGACAMASTDVRHGATIALPAATKAGHILDGWYTKAEGGNKISEGATILQNYGTLYAQFVPTYTIIWNDENGNELYREEKLIGESLTPPDYSKEDTQEWDYTFHGWNDGTTTYAANAIPAVSGAATYTADVTNVKNNYTLTIGVVKAGYGSVNETSVTVPYGTSVSTSGNVLTIGTTTVTATPTASNAQYTYTFSTWQNVPTSVTGNVTNIEAVFTRTLNTYTVTWKNGDATLETDENVAYGATPHYDGATPTKAADAEYTYTFNGWSPALGAISGTTVYTATYTSNPTVASVTAGGTTTYHTTIADAFTTANTLTNNPTVTMYKNASVESEIEITKTMTIDLNDKTISSTLASATGVFKINASGKTITIKDSGTGGKIYHKASTSSTNYLYGVNITDGSMSIESGTIYAENTGASRAYGINTATNAKLVTVSGSAIIEAKSSSSFGIYTNNTCSLTVNGGTFTATGSGSRGVYTKGTTKLTNATITASGSDSRAIFAKEGTMEINSGTYTAEGTGSVYVIFFESGKVTVNGGKFKGSTCEIAKRNSAYNVILQGGVYVHETDLAAKSTTPYHVLPITSGADYDAGYRYKVAEAYTVTFKDGDNNTIQSGLVEKNQTPVYSGATPTKTATAQYTYTFSGWSPAISAVTAAATYTAQFNSTVNTYTITWKNGDNTLETDKNVEYGATPSYDGETPVSSNEDLQYTYPFTGWSPDVVSVTGDATYTATFGNATAKTYPVVWKDWNGDTLCEDERKYGWSIPAYACTTPSRAQVGNKVYTFAGWSEPVSVVDGGDVTYTARYALSIDVQENEEVTEIAISENEDVKVTTVEVKGKLNVAEDATLTTEDLILEATPTSSGEITGTGTITATRAFFDLSNGEDGFKARTWYAVAVPWQVAVPAYEIPGCGVSITNDGEHYTQQELGRSFDLIYYDGKCRAERGVNDACWVYVEDDQQDRSEHYEMKPGCAYMIYLTSDAQTIRFERKEGADLLTNTLSVKTYELQTGNGKDANWNGIANPATYHAYINANAATYNTTFNAGQIYDAENRTYSVVDLRTHDLVVGQPVFVQATASNPSVAANPSHNATAPYYAPRRVQAQPLTRYDVMFAAVDEDVKERVIIRTDEDKEADEYIVGQDLAKMGVSSVVPQMWINRYDSRMCINTVAPVDNVADYPLGLFVPKNGEYDLFIADQPNSETMLYLTYDGEAIWNLSYGGYVLNLEKGTNAHYGLRIVYSAPKVATGIEEATIQNGDAIRKVIINDKVYIIRNGEMYSVDGQLVK